MKFLVYKDGRPCKEFTLSGAYLFGADMIPFRHVDTIRFSDGVIECAKKSADSAGLSLLWPVEGFGRLLLSTTRIPERPEPYILNVELARARLMQITLKREDWALFDPCDILEAQAQEAQDLFTDGVNQDALFLAKALNRLGLGWLKLQTGDQAQPPHLPDQARACRA